VNVVLKGGVFILLLFSIFILHSTTLPVLYSVFDMPLKRLPQWLRKDKKSATKDLFITYQHLPAKYRKYAYTVPLKMKFSVDKKSEYRFIVIAVKQRRTFSFLLGGVAKGTITVNGAMRKNIKTTSPIDPVVFSASFEPGNYLFVISVEKRFSSDIAPVLLSSRKVQEIHSSSFTKKSRANLRFYSIKPPKFHGFFTDWYQRHCFPEGQDKLKDDERTLRSLLLKNSHNKKELALLKSMGFNATMIEWWETQFSQKGVCHVQKY